MALWDRIIFFLRIRFESLIFWVLFILLVMISLWSLKIPNRSSLITEDIVLDKIDSTDSNKQPGEVNPIESNINFIDINKNLDQGDSTEGEKPEERTVDRDGLNDILIKQFPEQKKPDKLESQAGLGADKISINNKKLPRRKSYSTEHPVFEEKAFGYLVITLKNAHKYGYGYVFIDGTIWQQGEYNTTPLKIRLPVGYHKVEVKRDNFFSSPVDTAIFIAKGMEKRVSFVLIPKIKMGSVNSSMKNNISNR
jgi:hypothetical protein